MRQWDCGYDDLLDKAGLPTLRNRKMFLKQCTLFKIHAGLLYFPSDVFIRKIDRDDCLLNQFLQPQCFQNIFYCQQCFNMLEQSPSRCTADSVTSYF